MWSSLQTLANHVQSELTDAAKSVSETVTKAVDSTKKSFEEETTKTEAEKQRQEAIRAAQHPSDRPLWYLSPADVEKQQQNDGNRDDGDLSENLKKQIMLLAHNPGTFTAMSRIGGEGGARDTDATSTTTAAADGGGDDDDDDDGSSGDGSSGGGGGGGDGSSGGGGSGDGGGGVDTDTDAGAGAHAWFDMTLAMPFAILALQNDQPLAVAQRKYSLKMSEETFWRRYFSHVQMVRREFGVSLLPIATTASSSSSSLASLSSSNATGDTASTPATVATPTVADEASSTETTAATATAMADVATTTPDDNDDDDDDDETTASPDVPGDAATATITDGKTDEDLIAGIDDDDIDAALAALDVDSFVDDDDTGGGGGGGGGNDDDDLAALEAELEAELLGD